MKMTEFFAAQLEREAAATRRALERVPADRSDWRPHPRSMPLGYLASLVAKLPSWIEMMIVQDDYEMMPAEPNKFQPGPWATTAELVRTFDEGHAAARAALAGTTDAHLLTNWRLRVQGHVVADQPRHLMLADGVFSHLAHHRGQLTVYLRLNDVPVPVLLYGPSADEGGFA
jgi:uncharacterized damage-inducible protein DinB